MPAIKYIRMIVLSLNKEIPYIWLTTAAEEITKKRKKKCKDSFTHGSNFTTYPPSP